MSDIFRCSNCGQRIRRPDDPCSECGYEGRTHFRAGEAQFWVILRNWGPRADQLRDVLRRLYRVDGSILQDQELPLILYEGNDREVANGLEVTVRQHGGEIQIATDEQSIGELGSETPSHDRPQSRSSRFFSILVFIAMVAGSILSQQSEALREWFKTWTDRFKPVMMHQADPFAKIQLIVCVEEIAAGESITKERLGVVEVPRDQVPEGSFCPRDIGRLIGRQTITAIDRGVIIQESMIER